MTTPILTPTEYHALCKLLSWCWTSVCQEPELCLKEINYSSDSDDPIKTGECGLGLAEELKWVLDEPNDFNILTMIENLMYKLNANFCCDLGNSWETLSPIVDNNEWVRLNELSDDPDVTTQTLENYVLENICAKNKMANIQEFIAKMNKEKIASVDAGN